MRHDAKSIDDAKRELEREEANINGMLGSMDGAEYVGPRAPTLPAVDRSMEPQTFALSALGMLGARVDEESAGMYLVQENDGREWIRFEELRPTTAASPLRTAAGCFPRLVSALLPPAFITSGILMRTLVRNRKSLPGLAQ